MTAQKWSTHKITSPPPSPPPLDMRLSHRVLLLCLAYRQGRAIKSKRAGKKHSRYRKDFFKSLSIEERRRRYQKIPRCALIPLALSPWRKLQASRNDQAYITMMGFDIDSFETILKKFSPMYLTHTPFDASGMNIPLDDPRGRKRKVLPADCLGLVLVWTRTRGSMNVLQLVFGLTYTNLSVYLRFGIRLIVEIYGDDPLARVSLPSAEDIATYMSTFGERHPLLNDCWATMDGLKLYLQASGNSEIQE